MSKKILPDIPKHERRLVTVVRNGSAKTFIYSSPASAAPQTRPALMRGVSVMRKRIKRRVFGTKKPPQ